MVALELDIRPGLGVGNFNLGLLSLCMAASFIQGDQHGGSLGL